MGIRVYPVVELRPPIIAEARGVTKLATREKMETLTEALAEVAAAGSIMKGWRAMAGTGRLS
jgi:hypothetical protein